MIAERQPLIGHEDLERRVAVGDQRRQLLAEHLSVGSATMRWNE